MSDTTTIIILLVLIFLCLLMFVWYVSDMFTLLRYKTDVLEQQNAELMRRQTRNYEWFIKIARGEK
jgi:uncharacterized membrane protein YdbT with pleckstrin-like domain